MCAVVVHGFERKIVTCMRNAKPSPGVMPFWIHKCHSLNLHSCIGSITLRKLSAICYAEVPEIRKLLPHFAVVIIQFSIWHFHSWKCFKALQPLNIVWYTAKTTQSTETLYTFFTAGLTVASYRACIEIAA
jgi:hypothetical protein